MTHLRCLCSLPLVALAVVLAACGSVTPATTASVDASDSRDAAAGDGGPGDGGPGSVPRVPPDAASEAGSCVTSPKIGDACQAGDVSCDQVDACCAQTTACDAATHQWKDSGVACLLCNDFACGPKRCEGGTVCLTRGSGIDGGTTTYECLPMPAACSRNWTCGCITKSLPTSCTPNPSQGCAEQALHVTVSCLGA